MQLRYSLCHRELLEHARLHGEELAAMHQQNMDFQFSNPKNKLQQISISEGSKFNKLYNTIERTLVRSYNSYIRHAPQSKHLLQAVLERKTNRP